MKLKACLSLSKPLRRVGGSEFWLHKFLAFMEMIQFLATAGAFRIEYEEGWAPEVAQIFCGRDVFIALP
jgi:hypothetical protein